MDNQPTHSPSPTPAADDLAQQGYAVDYVRQQIAQIYGSQAPHQTPVHTPPAQAQSAALVPVDPAIHNEQARMRPAPASAPTSAPDAYSHTYQQAAPQAYDWQTYHQAWQQYYQQYYHRYYQQQLQQVPRAPAAPQPSQVPTENSAPSAPRKSSRLTAAIDHINIGPAGNSVSVQELRSRLLGTVESRAKKAQASPHFKPIITAVVVGCLFLFLQFNRTLSAQIKYYISPGTLTNEGSAIIINPTTTASVGTEPRVIIPKINVDVPVVYDEPSYDEKKIQQALQRGVVHYGTSAMPGQIGNNVIVGHSSNDLFDAGGFKFAFVLIDRLNTGDVFMLNYQGKRYVYKVYNKAVIVPSDFSLINITPDKPVVTLITCTPPGTALKRLLVQAEQISPEPNADQVAQQPIPQTSLPANMPGNSPTFLERIKNLF